MCIIFLDLSGNNNIQQVDRWIHREGSDYEKMIKNKIGKLKKKEGDKKYYNPEKSLLDKYPYHRFIKNLFN